MLDSRVIWQFLIVCNGKLLMWYYKVFMLFHSFSISWVERMAKVHILASNSLLIEGSIYIRAIWIWLIVCFPASLWDMSHLYKILERRFLLNCSGRKCWFIPWKRLKLRLSAENRVHLTCHKMQPFIMDQGSATYQRAKLYKDQWWMLDKRAEKDTTSRMM